MKSKEWKQVLFIFLIVLICQACAKGKTDLEMKTKEAYAYFSSKKMKDRFTIELLGNKTITSGFRIRIYNPLGLKIYEYNWAAGISFITEESRINEKAMVRKKILSFYDNFFDKKNFSKISDMKITGLSQSSDSTLMKDVRTDLDSPVFIFGIHDICVCYSQKYQKVIMFKAMKKTALKKYNLL